MLLPLDALFLYPPWRELASTVGVGIPHNHLITDTILQNYSWKAFAASAYAHREFPLWNPYILAGQPFLAAGQNASLYPPGVLFYVLPNGSAYGWFAALHFALAGLLTYWLCRVLGASRFGALVGGISFAFCGYLVVSVLWPMVVSTAAWLPGLLAVVERVIQRVAIGDRGRRGRSPVLLALVGAAIVCAQFLAGHLEMSLYLLITAGLYAAARLATVLAARCDRDAARAAEAAAPTASASKRPAGRITLAGLALLGMVALGTLGAAVQLIPFADAIAANVRVGQVSFDDVRGYALPREQLVAFLAPDYFGNPSHHAVFDLLSGRQRPVDGPIDQGPDPRPGTEWGPKNYVEGTAYLGVLPLLLALAALLLRRDAVTWTLAGLALACLLLAFGTPLYGLLFYGLPGVAQLHTPFRWVYPYSLCVAALAALGATSLEDRAGRPRRAALPGWLGIGLGAAGCQALVALLTSPGLGLQLAERALRRSSALREAFGEPSLLFSYEWSNLLGLALLLLASGLVVLVLRRGAPWARPLALLLLVGDLFSFGAGFNAVSDPRLLAVEPAAIQAIKADPGLFRITTLGPDDTLPANTGMLFGLQDIRGYDTIILREYVELLELLEPQRGLLFSKVHKLFEPRSLESPLIDLLNVKYVLTSLRLDSPKWELVQDGQTRVYRNRAFLPRAFLVEQAVAAADVNEALRFLTRPDFDPRQTVVLEKVEEPWRLDAGPVRGPPGPEPRIVSYGPNAVEVEASLQRPGYLVLSDVAFHDWVVSVNGVRQPLLRADRVFRAVELPAGEQRVRFEYRPLTFRVGGLLSALGLALAALALGAAAYARRAARAEERRDPVALVTRNSLFPLATGLANRMLDLAFALVYLRLMGPEGVGAYTFAVVVVGYFEIMTNFGLSTLLTREVARDWGQAGRLFWNALLARLSLATLAVLGLLTLVGPLAEPLEIGRDLRLALLLFTLGLIPGALAATSSAMFYGRERMEVPAAVTVLSTLLRIVFGTSVLVLGWGVVGLALVSLAINVVNALTLAGLQAAWLGWPRFELSWRVGRGLLASSWPLLLNDLLNSLFFRIDAVLLKPLAGEVALGYYSTAYRFIDGLQIIPSTFVRALFPTLSRQAVSDRTALAGSFALGLRVLLVLALPISVGTTLIAEPIIFAFAGRDYLPQSAWALQLLIWYLPFSFVNGLTQYVLIAVNRQRTITICFFVAALGNLLLNLALIPRYGFLGASFVTVVSELILLAPFWLVVAKELPPVPLLALTWRPALATAVMGGAVYWVRDFSPWLAIPLGALVYLAVLLALGGVSPEEIRALRRRRA